MEYGLIDICQKMLDNADMNLDLSSYPKVVLNFVVHGSVEGKFWELVFLCDETIFLKIKNDNDISANDIHFVLEVNVIKKSVDNVPENIADGISCPKPDAVWFIDVHGHMPLDLACCKFSWQLNELSEQEYESKYA